MPTYVFYRATFSDGTILERISGPVALRYGWRWRGKNGNGKLVEATGFAKTLKLAHSAMNNNSGWLTKVSVPGMKGYVKGADWKPDVVIDEEIGAVQLVSTSTEGPQS